MDVFFCKHRYEVVAEVASCAKKSRHCAALWARKRKLESHPPSQTKIAKRLFFAPGATSVFAFAPIVLLDDATFLQMTRLLQVTKNDKNNCPYLTSNRHHSISFAKTNAPGGLPSSGTAVSTDFLKKHPKKK